MPDGVEYVKGPQCKHYGCRTRWYYDEAGKTYCKNGHQVEQKYGQTVEDEDDFGKQGHVITKKKEVREKVLRIFQGEQAFRLFLQAYQLILWKQCHWLIHIKGFPPELEVSSFLPLFSVGTVNIDNSKGIVRDLWALRLQELSERATDISDTDEGQTLFSSQPVTDVESEDEVKRRPQRSQKKRHAKDPPRLVDTVGLCYLATLLLRLPVSLGDFYKWIVHEEIPYFRAIKHIPMEMRERLPGGYIQALDSLTILERDELHKTVFELAMLYQSDFEIAFPPLNSPLLLFRYIQLLALPLDVYPVAQRLGMVVDFDYLFPISYGRRASQLSYPEAQILSLLIIAVKLCYPFDGDKRPIRSAAEPAGLVLDWSKWKEIHDSFENSLQAGVKIGRNKVADVTESNVFDMIGDDLDRYMDWYQKTWVETDRRFGKASKQLLDMFPIDRPGAPRAPSTSANRISNTEDPLLAKLKEVQSTLRQARSLSDEQAEECEESILRPGMGYMHYRTESDLPLAARRFYEAAASAIGLSLFALTAAVFRTERRLEKWKEEQRKKERHMSMDIDEFGELSTNQSNGSRTGEAKVKQQVSEDGDEG